MADAGMDIAELSRRTGMTIRNIRAHQSRGLLPPPERRGRVGVYTGEHVRRIARIRDLQQRRFNLAAIRALLAAEDDLDGGRELRRLALAPLLHHDPLVIDRRELAHRFGYDEPSESLLRDAVSHGLARDLGDGRVEVTSRQLAEAGRELVSLGMTAAEVLQMQATCIEAMSGTAARFVDVCLERAWKPFAAEGYPAERWDQVVRVFERLVEQTSVVLMSTFSLQVRTAAETSLGDE